MTWIRRRIRPKAMRNRRAQDERGDGAPGGGALRLPFLFQVLGWSARDAVGFAVALLATFAILINVLFLQSGSHPAPMFKAAGASSKATDPEPKPAATPMRRVEVTTDIQRELARRGYYDGALDGLYGPRTDVAIRDFEHASGLKPSTQPNEALLQAIMRSPGKTGKGIT